MNTAPSENVSLDFDQLQKINVVEKRLGNLQKEVALAVDELTTTRGENEQLAKNNVYQQSVLDETLKKVGEAKATLNGLTTQIEDAITLLGTVTKESKEIGLVTEAKKIDIQKAENDLKTKEEDFAKKFEQLSKDTKELREEEEKVKEAEEILMDAIDKISKL